MSEEEVRKEYTHAQSNINIMSEVCNHLDNKKPTERLAWWKGYLAALKTVLKEKQP